MHKKLAKAMIASDTSLKNVKGTSCVSFTTTSENCIKGVRIFATPSDDYSSISKTFNSVVGIKMRAHGRNKASGKILYDKYKVNITGADSMRYLSSAMTYSFSKDNGEYWLTCEDVTYKENTVYTVRFHAIAEYAGQSTGLAIEYTDGTFDEILATDTECDIAFHSRERKTVYAIRQTATLGTITITPGTFGIFEGEFDYSFFEEYSGNEYIIPAKGVFSDIFNGKVYRSYIDTGKKYFILVVFSTLINGFLPVYEVEGSKNGATVYMYHTERISSRPGESYMTLSNGSQMKRVDTLEELLEASTQYSYYAQKSSSKLYFKLSSTTSSVTAVTNYIKANPIRFSHLLSSHRRGGQVKKTAQPVSAGFVEVEIIGTRPIPFSLTYKE